MCTLFQIHRGTSDEVDVSAGNRNIKLARYINPAVSDKIIAVTEESAPDDGWRPLSELVGL
jgi:RecJ-like exonuclease